MTKIVAVLTELTSIEGPRTTYNRTQSGLGLLFTLVLMLATLATEPPLASQNGQTPDPATFISGTVTGKGRGNIQIDHLRYDLARNLSLTDEDGEVMEFRHLAVGTEVKFHLKRGRIDFLVVILPR